MKEVKELTILLIDDNPAMLLALVQHFTLGRKRYLVTSVLGMVAALKLLETQSFDCIVVDWVMPDSDPIADLPELRKRAPASGIILVSGYDHSGPKFAPLLDNLGIDAFVSKSHIVRDLFPAIATAIKDRRASV